ncbi:hypothetical protein WH47_02481 [Habropoda laboriosa]|uniref:Uncharacterized protein n=1 Tax=Habropoda laboriosa TaxID=597456 RepID=A0A0L7QYA1_9HYME|nr:hypothetical protein WH47_02481 [Habropoda laboriosa]
MPVLRSPAVSDFQQGVKLTAIKLPSFGGNYSDWVKFRDTYLSIIHNSESLTNIQRFHYLNSEANYEIAWAALNRCFEDPKALVHHYATALLDLPPLTRESPKLLRTFIDDAVSYLESLRALGQPVENWNTFMVLIIARKLDAETYQE